MSIEERASLVPAAAVIPALLVYIIVAAVKASVVECSQADVQGIAPVAVLVGIHL